MRSSLTMAAAALLLSSIAACVPPPGATSSGHPNPIIVREFSASPGLVTLDPSFGFSLYRGSPGVPPRTRAASVARAAAFTLADTITTELGNLGYDVISSETAGAEPGGRALIITGRFDQIDEGRRRQGARVGVDVQVDYQAAGAAPVRLAGFRHAASGRAGGVNAAAAAVGHAIANYASALARNDNWPAASR